MGRTVKRNLSEYGPSVDIGAIGYPSRACFVFSWLARGVRQSGRSGVQAGFWQERSGLIVRSFEGKRYLVRLGGDGSDNKPFHGAAKSLA
jgi:hypothetical protein